MMMTNTGQNTFTSEDPASGEVVWSGPSAGAAEVDSAVARARAAFEVWGALPLAERAAYLDAFGRQTQARRAELIDAICRSTGKPKWESSTEVDAVVGKVALTIKAYRERLGGGEDQGGGMTSATRYKPHGVTAVFGPFNFPAHLPNGHILPALLAGNTVIFKPSEVTPLVGEVYAELWRETGLPEGVFGLLQGGRETGTLLGRHRDIDGLFFTGSSEAGAALARAAVDQPGKILALEMGGNNPLVVANVADPRAAAYWTIQSAFVTAGQRCNCARRLILIDDAMLSPLIEMTQRIRVGRYTDTLEPFMGPLITPQAATRVMDAQTELLNRGAVPLLPMKRLDDRAMLSPGIVDVTGIARTDVEIFGPLLQVVRVRDFDEAIHEANDTRYGLAASLFSDDRALYDTFFRRIRAGIVNWNRPTTAASSGLPFGGIKQSGNHRPSAYFAVDSCAYPIASIESPTLTMPATPSPGLV